MLKLLNCCFFCLLLEYFGNEKKKKKLVVSNSSQLLIFPICYILSIFLDSLILCCPVLVFLFRWGHVWKARNTIRLVLLGSQAPATFCACWNANRASPDKSVCLVDYEFEITIHNIVLLLYGKPKICQWLDQITCISRLILTYPSFLTGLCLI